MTRSLLAACLCVALPSMAFAAGSPAPAACNASALAAKANTAKGPDLVQAFHDLVACDPKQAEGGFDNFMKSSGDADTLVALTLAAIDAKIFTPVWAMTDKIKDYSQRSTVVEAVGEGCTDHPQVVTFVEGAYYGLRDVQFGQWADVIAQCSSPDLQKWTEGIVVAPPKASYDEKYNAIVGAFVKNRHTDALPMLVTAATAAAKNGGPFSSIVDKMDGTIDGGDLGAAPSADDTKKLNKALVDVANAVGPEQAATVGDKLNSSGDTADAASLLGHVYADKKQKDGKLLYGVASIEVCDKDAVIHYASVTDPMKRWSIVQDVEPLARAFKPKLKCTSTDPWPVAETNGPVMSSADISKWVDTLVKQYGDKGVKADTKSEKSIDLP